MSLPKPVLISLCLSFLVGGFILAAGCMTDQSSGGVTPTPTVSLTYYTEQMPPYNFEENGTLQGIAVDLLEEITAKMGTPVSRNQVHLVPWTEGYQAVLKGPNSVLFTAARLPQRETLFKWVGPIYPYTNVLFARSDREIIINGTEELKAFRIGVIVDDVAILDLQEAGVNSSLLVQEVNASNLVNKLQSGEIDLWGYTEAAGKYFARKTTGNESYLKVVYRLPDMEGYYIFSKDVPDEIVQSFQRSLDALKQEKDTSGITTYERIVRRYVSSTG